MTEARRKGGMKDSKALQCLSCSIFLRNSTNVGRFPLVMASEAAKEIRVQGSRSVAGGEMATLKGGSVQATPLLSENLANKRFVVDVAVAGEKECHQWAARLLLLALGNSLAHLNALEQLIDFLVT